MQVFLLTALTMTAFAANSVLTRMGVAQFGTDPMVFAVVRVAAGAVMLAVLCALRGGNWLLWGWERGAAAVALAVYMAGFSVAYLALDAGVGALILFGIVQMTMFGGAAIGGEAIGRMRVIGAALAMVGLGVLVWPSEAVVLPLAAVGWMSVAAIGWGVYSLLGRGAVDPLAATAMNLGGPSAAPPNANTSSTTTLFTFK